MSFPFPSITRRLTLPPPMDPDKKNSSDPFRTRISLLHRVKDLDDKHSWGEFFTTYERLVRGVARQRGLSEHEAEEVALEVFNRIARTIHEFTPAEQPGSFRNWLFRLTRWRANDKLRERARHTHTPFIHSDGSDTHPSPTSEIEKLPAPDFTDAQFEAEARRHMLDTLFKRLESKVPPKHLQIFQLLVIDQRPVSEIADLFDMNAAAIYVIKHRIAARMREEVEKLPIHD